MVKIYDYTLLQKVKDNGGFCLCTVDKVPCMCDEFKKEDEGLCHCKVYIKTK